MLKKGADQLLSLFVFVEAKHPSQQFFSHVGTEPPLPGYYQYFWGVKCLAQRHITADIGFEPRPLTSESGALPLHSPSCSVTAQFISAIYYLNSKSQASSQVCGCIQPGFCRNWSETPKTGFLMTWIKCYG